MSRTLAVLLGIFLASYSIHLSLAQEPAAKEFSANAQSQPNSPAPCETTTDGEGEPLPTGVLARLGSVRWRHGGRITGSALSNDGKRLATASPESVAVWDTATGKVLFRFPGLTREVRSDVYGNYSGPAIISFSPDGNWLGTAMFLNKAGVWNLKNGGDFRCFAKDEVSQGVCGFTPDSKEFLLACANDTQFWDLATGKLLRKTPATDISDVSADSRMYLRLDRDRGNAISIRNLRTDVSIMKFDVSFEFATAAVAPDSKSLVLVDNKKKEVQIWDIGATKPRLTFPVPKSAIGHYLNTGEEYLQYCVRFSPDSKQLLMGTRGGTIHRWDLAAKKELPEMSKQLRRVVSVHASPDGKTVMTTESNGLIRRWDANTNREASNLGNYQGTTYAVLSPDGHLAAVSDDRGRVDLWDLKTTKLLRTLRREGTVVSALAFAPDGKTLAAGIADGNVTLYDVPKGREVSVIPFRKTGKEFELDLVLSTMLFSPDGSSLFAYCGQGEFQMWNLSKNEVRWRVEGKAHWQRVPIAVFSADGNTLAFLAGGPKVTIFDAHTGKQRRVITLDIDEQQRGPACVDTLALAPDGRHLAVALSNNTIAILDIETGTEIARWADDGFSWPLAFSPDGQLLAACGIDAVCLRDTLTGKEVLRLNGHRDSVTSIAFSPDGRRLLSCGEDSQIYLWTLRPKSVSNNKRPLESVWLDLGADDSAKAYRAVWELFDHPGAAEFLRAKIAPIQAADQANLAGLLADLDSASFQKRQAAVQDLTRLGESAAGALEAALKKSPSAEAERRIREILEPLRNPTHAQMQQLRAVQALELAATPDSRRLIQRWSEGAKGCRLTEASRAAFGRLDSRK